MRRKIPSTAQLHYITLSSYYEKYSGCIVSGCDNVTIPVVLSELITLDLILRLESRTPINLREGEDQLSAI